MMIMTNVALKLRWGKSCLFEGKIWLAHLHLRLRRCRLLPGCPSAAPPLQRVVQAPAAPAPVPVWRPAYGHQL